MHLAAFFPRAQALLVTVVFLLLAAGPLSAQQTTVESLKAQVRELQLKVYQLENGGSPSRKSPSEPIDAGVVLVFCGGFCALWAQNTGRSAWQWFFLGLFFNVITIIVLLVKNSNDRKPANPRLFSEGRKFGE